MVYKDYMSDAFTTLERLIRREMRMSHIYQPVMLLEIPRSCGTVSIDEIAKALLLHVAKFGRFSGGGLAGVMQPDYSSEGRQH